MYPCMAKKTSPKSIVLSISSRGQHDDASMLKTAEGTVAKCAFDTKRGSLKIHSFSATQEGIQDAMKPVKYQSYP